MKKYYLIHLLSIGLCVLMVSACTNPAAEKATSEKTATETSTTKANAFDDQLVLIAKTVNSTLPVKVDETISVDSVVALPGGRLLYKYSMSDMSPGDMDTLTFKKTMVPMLLSSLKGNSAIKIMADNNVSFIYQYNGKKGAYLFSVYIDPSMYKKQG